MTRLTSLTVALFLVTATVGTTVNAQNPGAAGGNDFPSGSRLHPLNRPRITNRVQPASAVMPIQARTASQAGVINGDEVIFDEAPETVVGDEVVIGDDMEIVEGEYFEDGYDSVASVVPSLYRPRRLCICLPLNGWVHAEYLLWWQKGMYLPPLVTTSPNNGKLPTAGVLYGGDDSNLNGSMSGGRIRFGTWFDRYPGWGLEGEFFALGKQTDSFFRQSDGTGGAGNPMLARPFFNMLNGQQDAQMVANTASDIKGSVGVDVSSQFQGAAARLRHNIFSREGCGRSWLTGGGVPVASRLDMTVGYRYYELRETLDIDERLTVISNNNNRFVINDHFDTRNQFNGGEIGVVWQGRRGLWSLDGLMRVGIGNNRETVVIRGSTATTENAVTTNYTTGILTQPTNIGTHARNQFCMIPELGATLGYQFTRRLRLTAGYSAIYWGSVLRPGDQVDLDVNPNYFAPAPIPVTGPQRPQFQFVSSDYWVHGLSFGAEFRW